MAGTSVNVLKANVQASVRQTTVLRVGQPVGASPHLRRVGWRTCATQGFCATMPVVPIALMLATLTDRRDFGEDWLLERKFDGERYVARKDGGEVRLESRTAKDLTGTYPEVRSALASQRAGELVLDGEVVAYDGDQTSFSRL